jgi:hypothetical protein
MATEKQIAANRLNAQQSTGPKTPEGRAAVRLNGVKHGLNAKTLVLKGESESDFNALVEAYQADHAPATATEEALVVQLVMATWRLRRLYHAEAGFYTYKMGDTADSRKARGLDDDSHRGLVADRSNQTLDMFHRQEVRLERTFHKALHELKRLQAQRPADLGLVSTSEPATQPEASSNSEISNIQKSDPAPAVPNPDPDPTPSPESTIHLVPPADDMQ